MKQWARRIVYALITTCIIATIVYFVIGHFASISVDASYINLFDPKINKNVSIAKVIILNEKLIDLSDINLLFLDTSDSCPTLHVYLPNITPDSLTKGCYITHPENGIGSNAINIYCERINTMGSFEVTWTSWTEPLTNCSFAIKYQSSIKGVPFFRFIKFKKNDIPKVCGDSICATSEINLCCIDCGCPEGYKCWKERCVIPELTVKSFGPNSSVFYLGEKAYVRLEIEGNAEFDYNFSVYWKHESSKNYDAVYSNSSHYPIHIWWNIWYPVNKKGVWESILIFNYNNKQIEKMTSFSVIEKDNKCSDETVVCLI